MVLKQWLHKHKILQQAKRFSTARLETNMCEPISKFANEYMLRASVSCYDAFAHIQRR